MDILKALLHALWQQDYEMLSDPTLVWAIDRVGGAAGLADDGTALWAAITFDA